MVEKKIKNFSTRWTETMDNALNDLSKVMMISKQDLIRVALSEYIMNKNELINNYREYKKSGKEFYENYSLCKYEINNSKNIINGVVGVETYIDEEENKIYDPIELVDIEIGVCKSKDLTRFNSIYSELKVADESQKQILKKELEDLLRPQYNEIITLKFTEEGEKVSGDPKFRHYLEQSIKEIVEEIRSNG